MLVGGILHSSGPLPVRGTANDYLARIARRSATESSPNVPAELDRLARLSTFRRGDRVCGPMADPLHRVMAGSAKTVTVLPGGRQQTVDLLFEGDFFAFDWRHRESFVVE